MEMETEKAVVMTEKLPAQAGMYNKVDVQELLDKALEKDAPLEVIDRIMDLIKYLKAEAAREEFFRALSAFQAEVPSIPKTKKVFGKNGALRYCYAPLEAIVATIRPLIDKWGFSYTIQTRQTANSVTAICVAHHREGHSETTEFTVPIDPEAYMNEAQKTASALTYAKRYAFCDAFGILTADEDDDAQHSDYEHAAGRHPREKSKRPPKPQCPDCGKHAIIKDRFKGGWLCWPKIGGCNAHFDTLNGENGAEKPQPDEPPLDESVPPEVFDSSDDIPDDIPGYPDAASEEEVETLFQVAQEYARLLEKPIGQVVGNICRKYERPLLKDLTSDHVTEALAMLQQAIKLNEAGK